MDVKLVQFGEYGIQHHHWTGKECTIGREPTCDVRPDHGRVCHRHTRLFWQGSRLLVEDLNSAGGTSLNGLPVSGEAVEVADGDELCVGPVHFLVMITEDESEMARRDDSWVTSTLRDRIEQLDAERAIDPTIAVSPAMKTARRILDHLTENAPHDRPAPIRSSSPRHDARQLGLEISEEQGIALAKILNRSVIDEVEIRRIGHQLQELIASGRNRIALHFGNVEQFSSQALGTVLDAYRQCREAGGALKICTLRPSVAELFTMVDIHQKIEIYPDHVPAMESVWPKPASRLTPPADAADRGEGVGIASARSADPASATVEPDLRVRLIVEVGKSKGQVIEVKGPRFVIGRDRRCQLRPNSDTVSRIHAIIERRDGKVFVRDYGTKNGTILAGRVLRGEEAEAHDGETLQVGILKFSLQIMPIASSSVPTDDDSLAAWLLEQGPANEEAPTEYMIPTASHHLDETDRHSDRARPVAEAPLPETAPDSGDDLSTPSMLCEVVRNVLVARIRDATLDDEATVGPLRYELQILFDKPLPRRVVLSLENVKYLSSRAVGVILAFFQHLDREHGALRICCVNPSILPVLDSMRLSSLVEMYPTVEEAVNDPWI